MKAEASLAFLAYNMKRVMNILGIKEIIRKLIGKTSPVNPIFSIHIALLDNIRISAA